MAHPLMVVELRGAPRAIVIMVKVVLLLDVGHCECQSCGRGLEISMTEVTSFYKQDGGEIFVQRVTGSGPRARSG